MIKRLAWICLFLSLIFTAAVAFAWINYQRFLQPFPAGGEVHSVEVTIEPGSSARSILETLESEGVLQSARATRLYLVYALKNPILQAGDYSFTLPSTPVAVLQRIIEGDVVLDSVTVVEGLTLFETAEQLASAGFGNRQTLLEEMHRVSLVEDLDPVASNLEGYLFPDTYSFPRTVTERQIVSAMVANFRKQTRDLRSGKDLRSVVVLASIVEKEASIDRERPLIAGVYAHRLRRGIGLYADPTIIYGKKLAGTWSGNLTRQDLRMDSPYNTYTRPGLPPGPICSPGRASLEAAAEPPEVPYLYFVSRNDGSHVFSKTLTEHNRNVEKWQRLYWRNRQSR